MSSVLPTIKLKEEENATNKDKEMASFDGPDMSLVWHGRWWTVAPSQFIQGCAGLGLAKAKQCVLGG